MRLTPESPDRYIVVDIAKDNTPNAYIETVDGPTYERAARAAERQIWYFTAICASTPEIRSAYSVCGNCGGKGEIRRKTGWMMRVCPVCKSKNPTIDVLSELETVRHLPWFAVSRAEEINNCEAREKARLESLAHIAAKEKH